MVPPNLRRIRDVLVLAGVTMHFVACASPSAKAPAPAPAPVPAASSAAAPIAAAHTVPEPAAPEPAQNPPPAPSLDARADALATWLNAHLEVEAVVNAPLPAFMSSQGLTVCYVPELMSLPGIPGRTSLCWREPAGTEPVTSLGIYRAPGYEPGKPRIEEGVHSLLLFLSRDAKRGLVRELRFPALEGRTLASLPVARRSGNLEFVELKYPRPEKETWQALTPAESPALLALRGASSAYTLPAPERKKDSVLRAVQIPWPDAEPVLHKTIAISDTLEPGVSGTILGVRTERAWSISSVLRQEWYETFSALVDATHITGAANTYMAVFEFSIPECSDGYTVEGLAFFEATAKGLEERGRIPLKRVGLENAINPQTGKIEPYVWLPGEEQMPALSTRVALSLHGSPGCVETRRTELMRVAEGRARGLPKDFQPFLKAGPLHWTAEGWTPGACPASPVASRP